MKSRRIDREEEINALLEATQARHREEYSESIGTLLRRALIHDAKNDFSRRYRVTIGDFVDCKAEEILTYLQKEGYEASMTGMYIYTTIPGIEILTLAPFGHISTEIGFSGPGLAKRVTQQRSRTLQEVLL